MQQAQVQGRTYPHISDKNDYTFVQAWWQVKRLKAMTKNQTDHDSTKTNLKKTTEIGSTKNGRLRDLCRSSCRWWPGAPWTPRTSQSRSLQAEPAPVLVAVTRSMGYRRHRRPTNRRGIIHHGEVSPAAFLIYKSDSRHSVCRMWVSRYIMIVKVYQSCIYVDWLYQSGFRKLGNDQLVDRLWKWLVFLGWPGEFLLAVMGAIGMPPFPYLLDITKAGGRTINYWNTAVGWFSDGSQYIVEASNPRQRLSTADGRGLVRLFVLS